MSALLRLAVTNDRFLALEIPRLALGDDRFGATPAVSRSGHFGWSAPKAADRETVLEPHRRPKTKLLHAAA
jgi:hypothetical protein